MAKRHEHTEVRQVQIMDAARKLIFKYGSEHVTVRRIAHEVGISEAAIYRHFRSKDSILSFLAGQMANNLLLDISAAQTSESSTLAILDQALLHHFSEVEQRKGISFQVIAEIVSLGNRKLNKQVYEDIGRYLKALKILLARCVEAGDIRHDVDLDLSVLMLFGMIQGLVNLWTLGNRCFNLVDQYTALWEHYKATVLGVSVRKTSE